MSEGFIQYRWGRYNLDQIWGMVAHEDGTVTAAQVQAWRRMAELCQDQANALEQAVGQLFHRWPPRPESAAAAFRDRILDLINSMKGSADHAATMPDPLWKITNQLTMTRYDILDLLRQRTATEEIERSQDPTHGYNGKAGGRPEPDALPANWRDQFDQKARQIMVATEAVITQAATHLRVPPAYRPSGQFDPGQPVGGDTPASGGHSGEGLLSKSMPAEGSPWGAPVTHPGFPSDYTGSDAPILAGSETPSASTTTPGLNTPSLGGGPPSLGSPLGAFPTVGVVGGPLVESSASPTGAPTAAGRSAPSAPKTLANQGPMVAPMSGRPLTSSAGSSGVRPSGRRRFRQEEDEPWGGRSGVPAVLEPTLEPIDHDPGPGVIGIDR